MLRLITLCPVLLAGILLLPGCGDTSKTQDAGDNGGGDVAAKVKTVVLDYDGLMQLVESKKGKVVVMDCWALW